MISATGKSRFRQIGRAGFSLIEILLVLAIAAVLSGVVVLSAEALMKPPEDRPIDEQVKRVVREARFRAAESKQMAYMTFDEEASMFVIQAESGAALGEGFPSGYDPEATDLTVAFYVMLPSKGDFRGFDRENEREQRRRVAFAPDRSSNPFEVVWTVDGETERLRFDPFSDAVVSMEEDN